MTAERALQLLSHPSVLTLVGRENVVGRGFGWPSATAQLRFLTPVLQEREPQSSNLVAPRSPWPSVVSASFESRLGHEQPRPGIWTRRLQRNAAGRVPTACPLEAATPSADPQRLYAGSLQRFDGGHACHRNDHCRRWQAPHVAQWV